jgi:hypothetical protein
MLLERELVKKCSLFDLPVPHHDFQPRQLDGLNHRCLCVATAPFFNKIDPKQARSAGWYPSGEDRLAE